MNIGIVGAGALGLTFAAQLAGTHDVIVLARRREVADALAGGGIAVEDGSGATTVARVGSGTDPRALADRDAVIVAVKSYATHEALAPLHGVLARNTLVASVQNGIGNGEAARAALPDAHVIEGVTNQGAILIADARIHPVNRGTTRFERGRPGERGDALAADWPPVSGDDLAAAFGAAGLDARAVDDIAPLLWRKLVASAAINPLGALAGRPNGAVLDDPDLAPLARALAAEAAAVAARDGVSIPDPWAAVEAAARPTASNRNSMLQDLDAGRPTEIEAIAGAIVRRAAAHGVAVPLTETMLRLVRARERA